MEAFDEALIRLFGHLAQIAKQEHGMPKRRFEWRWRADVWRIRAPTALSALCKVLERMQRKGRLQELTTTMHCVIADHMRFSLTPDEIIATWSKNGWMPRIKTRKRK